MGTKKLTVDNKNPCYKTVGLRICYISFVVEPHHINRSLQVQEKSTYLKKKYETSNVIIAIHEISWSQNVDLHRKYWSKLPLKEPEIDNRHATRKH